ncbi:MAG TPA: DNA gyrase inhibitor YacG [Dongiaceae bacterium]
MSGANPATGKGKCPICGKPVSPDFRPFCSTRCKQVDLNRWFSESYRVPEKPGEEEPVAGPGGGDDEE